MLGSDKKAVGVIIEDFGMIDPAVGGIRTHDYHAANGQAIKRPPDRS